MKLAVISPASLLANYSTDYHLVLTQYYRKIDKYRNYYLDIRKQPGHFIILDNGAAELTESAIEKNVIEVAFELRPNVLVAPDVVHDMSKTLLRTLDFIGSYAYMLHSRDISIMAVPQGETKEEWLECFNVFNNSDQVHWLGISMFYDKMFGGRVNVLDSIKDIVKKPCHLLGMWNNPFKLAFEKAYPYVQGVDTAKPVEFGMRSLTLDQWPHHYHIDDDTYFDFEPPRPDIWNWYDSVIRRNIKQMLELVA